MVTRRDVVQMGAWGTVAAAIRPIFAALPTKGGEPSGFKEAVFGQMKLKRVTVDIGLGKPVTVVQASDSHITYVSPPMHHVVALPP